MTEERVVQQIDELAEELFHALRDSSTYLQQALAHFFDGSASVMQNPIRVLSSQTEKSPAEIADEWIECSQKLKAAFLKQFEDELRRLRPRMRQYRERLHQVTEVLEAPEDREPPDQEPGSGLVFLH